MNGGQDMSSKRRNRSMQNNGNQQNQNKAVQSAAETRKVNSFPAPAEKPAPTVREPQNQLPIDRVVPLNHFYYRSEGGTREEFLKKYLMEKATEESKKYQDAVRKQWEAAVAKPLKIVSDWEEIFQSCLADKKFVNSQFLPMEGDKVWMDTKLLALYPVPNEENFKWGSLDEDELGNTGWIESYEKKIDGFTFRAPTRKDLQTTWITSNPYINNGYLKFGTRSRKSPNGRPDWGSSSSGVNRYDTENSAYIRFHTGGWWTPKNAGQYDDRYYFKSFLIYKNENRKKGAYLVFGTHGDGNNSSNYFYILLPICHLIDMAEGQKNDSLGRTLFTCLENKLIPKDMPAEVKEKFRALIPLYQKYKKYLKVENILGSKEVSRILFDDNIYLKDYEGDAAPIKGTRQSAIKSLTTYISLNNEISFDQSAFLKDVDQGTFTGTFNDFDFDLAKRIRDEGDQILMSPAEEQLSISDYHRANLTPYEKSWLTDVRKGFWELYDEESDPEGYIRGNLPENVLWMARPPQLDVKKNGFCAIDFGTKSTTVVCRDGKGERLLRIGQGNVKDKPEQKDYENPTVIQVRDFDAFMAAYNGREGRPFTRWEDMLVSHQAADILSDEQQGNQDTAFYSVFNELKQWANDPKERIYLKDSKKGKLIELKPFLELQDGDFNPIEMYAYYLGLYINTMRTGIYLKYLMSYPVTYPVDVRERVRKSFEKGLKKSLPSSILKDQNLMDSFSVELTASEPAAYAMGALKKLGLQPVTDQVGTFYAVFDMGGGTTDFDFGIENLTKKPFRYTIHRFAAGGDDHLGGENLLALMAYRVYRNNISVMRKPNLTQTSQDNQPKDRGVIPIVQPYGGETFGGSEGLVEDRNASSREARLNMRILQEKLRPWWEGKGKGESDDQTWTLYDENGKPASVNLKVHYDKLQKEVVEKRIDQGISSFYAALCLALLPRVKDTDCSCIHILLAGNSCKSSIVRGKMKSFFEKKNNAFRDKAKASDIFVIHESPDLMESAGNTPAKTENEQNAQGQTEGNEKSAPEIDYSREVTGKTGVAFGLLRARSGGRDVKVIDEDLDQDTKEARFPYYLGEISWEDDRFHVLIDLDVPKMRWTKYVDASGDFELLYTKDARAKKNQLSEEDEVLNDLPCELPESTDEEGWYVYIRKTGASSLEYAVANEKQMKTGKDTPVLKDGKKSPVHEVNLED